MSTELKTLAAAMPVCWKASDGVVAWGNAVAIEFDRDSRIVRFDDGGWNPADICFFTERQCRLFHGMPRTDLDDKSAELAARLREIADELSFPA